MIKEELEKEAKEWAEDHHYYNGTTKGYVAERDSVINGYLAGAEPREKKIAELEEKLANADYQLEGRDNEIRQLKEQIEKVKSDVREEIGFAKNFNELYTYSVLNNLLNRWEIKNDL